MNLIDEYDGFLCDLDGVVWVGDQMVPGAVETLSEVVNAGKGLVFVTNDPRTTAHEIAIRLRKTGIPIQEDGVLTSAQVTAEMAARVAGEVRAMAIGTDSFHQEVARSGLTVVTDGGPVEVVLVAGHIDFNYRELRAATKAVFSGAHLFATNKDPTLPMPDGLWPGTGAIVAALEYATSATATVCGKPQRHLFDLGRARLGGEGRLAMIGDRLDSDIAGGRDAGLDTVLVLTGATDASILAKSDVHPDHVIESITGLIN